MRELCKCEPPNIPKQPCKGGCENCRYLNYIALTQNIFYLDCKQGQDKPCKCQKCQTGQQKCGGKCVSNNK